MEDSKKDEEEHLDDSSKKHQWMLELEEAKSEEVEQPPDQPPKKGEERKTTGRKGNRLLVEALKKIPILQGLSPSLMRKILGLCTLHSYAPEENVCEGGDRPSDKMFILLSGELAVLTPERLRVATVIPVTTVGEMGFITRQARSATVEAIQPSHILVISKSQFDHLLRNDRELQVAIFRNVIDILGTKLVKDNIRTRDYLLEKASYESRLNAQAQKIEAALRLLVNRAQITRDEAELYLADEIKDTALQILIVDDEPDIRSLVKNVLSPYDVVEAGDGEEALEMIQEEPPDLMIADIRMPKMDGTTLLTHVRDLYPDLPVLALSGYLKPEEVQDYAFDGFIEKPIQLEAFMELVEKTLVRDPSGP